MTLPTPPTTAGKLIGDVPAATAILDRFLHHAEVITITGKSYRLRNKTQTKTCKAKEKKATLNRVVGFDPLFGGWFSPAR